MATPINVGLFGTATIDQSGDYAVNFLGVGTLNITGAGVVANLSSIAGVGLADSINVENGARAILGGIAGVNALTSFNISSGGTLEISSALNVSLLSSITFSGPGTLVLDPGLNVGLLNGPINGFGASDVIDYSAVANGFTYTPGTGGGTLTLTENGTAVGSLQLSGSYSQSDFAIRSDGHGGTDIVFACFLRGTHLATPDGEVRVEDLRVGDLVLTKDGGARPVKWIGQRALRRGTQSDQAGVQPVRVTKGSLGEATPHRDLYLSPDHCLFCDGSLIPAQLLVNGTTIVQDWSMETFEYFHIELDLHDVLIAEGAPAESFLDTGNRDMFANNGVVQLFPAYEIKTWEDACAPLILAGPELDMARARIAERAAELQVVKEKAAA
jgi:hypothetical protein